MRYFSWKWVSFGLAYSLVVMSVLQMGLPAEVGGKPVSELVLTIYAVLVAGWGNFTVITVIAVLAFSTFPWAMEKDKIGDMAPAPGVVLATALATALGAALGAALMVVLMAVLGVVLATALGVVLATALGVVLGAVLGAVLGVVLVGVVLHSLKGVVTNLARNIHIAFAKDD